MEKFSDSQQQEAWREYAKSAIRGFLANMGYDAQTNGQAHVQLTCPQVALVADAMLAEEMKRARG